MANLLRRILHLGTKPTSAPEPGVEASGAAPAQPLPVLAPIEQAPAAIEVPVVVPVPEPPAPVLEPPIEAAVPALVEAPAPVEAATPVDSFHLNPPLPTARRVAPVEVLEPKSRTRKAPAPSRASKGRHLPRSPRKDDRKIQGEVRMKPKAIAHARLVNFKPALALPSGHNGTNGHASPKKGTATARPDPEASLAWLQFLAKNVHAGGLHLLLAYYRRLGWIPKGAYAWLRDLASGVSRQANRMTWDTLRIEPDRLIEIHAKSYRALLELFPPATEAAPPGANGHAVALVTASMKRRN
ncbi:MAG: hypothetical protein HYT80_06620 [Euryarchaeota archaeon]|nr:hypothetical protein [Euryarchaeota archaeon]